MAGSDRVIDRLVSVKNSLPVNLRADVVNQT